jgi:stage IV sporulation protein FB
VTVQLPGRTFDVVRVAGVPIRFHISLLALPVLGFLLGWGLVGGLAAFGIIFLHEVGHAVVVRLAGGRPTGILLHVLGGWCEWRGNVSPVGRAAIAWGGVWAQLLIFAVSFLVPVTGLVAAELVAVARGWNVQVMVLNLIPMPPFDGAEAWPLIPMLWRKWGWADRWYRLRTFRERRAKAKRAKHLSVVDSGRNMPRDSDKYLH